LSPGALRIQIPPDVPNEIINSHIYTEIFMLALEGEFNMKFQKYPNFEIYLEKLNSIHQQKVRKAIANYAHETNRPLGLISVDEVENSALGIEGYANMPRDE
jgi:hypothetical protein